MHTAHATAPHNTQEARAVDGGDRIQTADPIQRTGAFACPKQLPSPEMWKPVRAGRARRYRSPMACVATVLLDMRLSLAHI